jgi:hypothetical protein
MASVQGCFIPGFLQGAGFSGEQYHHSDHVGNNRFSVEEIAPAWLKNSAGAVLSGIQTLPEQSSLDSAGAASRYLRGNHAPEKKSSGILEARWKLRESAP